MNLLFDVVAGILRGVAKVVFFALAALFAVVVLGVGLVIVAALVLRFLLTGRKPTVVTTFSRFSEAAQRFRPGGWTGARTDSADVVDVQAHEVAPAPNATLPPKAAD